MMTLMIHNILNNTHHLHYHNFKHNLDFLAITAINHPMLIS